MLSFGVSFMADPPVSDVVEKTVLAEANGFDYAWVWDSHVLWQEVYPIFALMADRTKRIHIGPCVTNPITRDPAVTASAMATLNEISGGRMEMGIGRGDSAQRVLGRKPVNLETLEAACRLIRDLTAGREVDVEGTKAQLKWSLGHELPIWVAAYGPKALATAGRVGDGVILQLADPYIIEWSLKKVREAAEAAGRNFADIKVMAAAPAYVTDDINHAREQVRWFPALVSNHVVDMIKRHPMDDLPHELTDYVAQREKYDYAHHGRAGSDNATFVTDEIVDRFCVIGNLEECIAKLRTLESLGVHQFNIYSMVDDPRAVIRTFGEKIIPAFTTAAAAAR